MRRPLEAPGSHTGGFIRLIPLVVLLASCQVAPRLGEKPLVKADVEATVKAGLDNSQMMKDMIRFNSETGDTLKVIEQKVDNVQGVIAETASGVQALRDVKPSAGRDAFTLVEHGGAWAVVIVVLGLGLIWQWSKAKRLHRQRDGMAERLAGKGEKVRKGA